MVMPGVSVANSPYQVTGLMPPGRSDGTGYPTADRNVLPLRTIVTQAPPLKVVWAPVAVGEKVTQAFGTATSTPANWIVEFRSTTVTGSAPRFCTLRTLLNQMTSPPWIGVPLKFAVMALAPGT